MFRSISGRFLVPFFFFFFAPACRLFVEMIRFLFFFFVFCFCFGCRLSGGGDAPVRGAGRDPAGIRGRTAPRRRRRGAPPARRGARLGPAPRPGRGRGRPIGSSVSSFGKIPVWDHLSDNKKTISFYV